MTPIGRTVDRWIDFTDRAVRVHPRRWMVLFLLLTLATLGFELDQFPVTRRSEWRVFQVAERMLESGDWLVPYLDDQPRLQKPPLFYWTTGVFSLPYGEVVPLSLRLTSVLSAALLLCVVYRWGRALYGPGLGLLASVILASTFQFWVNGRRGDAEMLLALTATVSLALFERMDATGDRRLLPWFALSFTLAFLAKATVAVLLVGLPALLWVAVQRRFEVFTRTLVWKWLAVSAVLCLTWYLAVLCTVPDALDLFRHAVMTPMGQGSHSADAAHWRPVSYYLAALPGVLGLPLLFLPVLFLHMKAAATRPDPVRFQRLASLALLIAFSLIPAKQRHYLLPILPLLALAIAHRLLCIGRDSSASLLRWLRSGIPVSMLLFAGFPVLGAGLLWHLRAMPGWWFAGTLVVGLGLALFHVRGISRGRPVAALAASVAATHFLLAPIGLSLDLWSERFDSGTVAESRNFQAERWERTFQRFPPLRRAFHAEHWASGSTGESKLGRQP